MVPPRPNRPTPPRLEPQLLLVRRDSLSMHMAPPRTCTRTRNSSLFISIITLRREEGAWTCCTGAGSRATVHSRGSRSESGLIRWVWVMIVYFYFLACLVPFVLVTYVVTSSLTHSLYYILEVIEACLVSSILSRVQQNKHKFKVTQLQLILRRRRILRNQLLNDRRSQLLPRLIHPPIPTTIFSTGRLLMVPFFSMLRNQTLVGGFDG